MYAHLVAVIHFGDVIGPLFYRNVPIFVPIVVMNPHQNRWTWVMLLHTMLSLLLLSLPRTRGAHAHLTGDVHSLPLSLTTWTARRWPDGMSLCHAPFPLLGARPRGPPINYLVAASGKLGATRTNSNIGAKPQRSRPLAANGTPASRPRNRIWQLSGKQALVRGISLLRFSA